MQILQWSTAEFKFQTQASWIILKCVSDLLAFEQQAELFFSVFQAFTLQ